MSHHEGEVQGEAEDDDEGPLMLWESLPEVANGLPLLRETEQASAGSFFIGDRAGEPDATASTSSSSSSPEDPLLSKREGEVSGVSNEVSAPLLHLASSFSYMGFEIYTRCSPPLLVLSEKTGPAPLMLPCSVIS